MRCRVSLRRKNKELEPQHSIVVSDRPCFMLHTANLARPFGLAVITCSRSMKTSAPSIPSDCAANDEETADCSPGWHLPGAAIGS